MNKGYPPENAETLANRVGRVEQLSFQFLEKVSKPLENTFAMVRKKWIFTVTLEGVFASFPGITARLTVKLLPNNATTSRTSSFFYLYTEVESARRIMARGSERAKAKRKGARGWKDAMKGANGGREGMTGVEQGRG
ncbi:hypothetical protein B0H14DRAFT_2629975 [Mycena olivaceomarginata]|nr:hypothetical protein B0H14DRAFT_2629975 [Mycena olivaceomarginata]